MESDLFKPDFVAIDFEHANNDKGTICSVGIASFKNGNPIDQFSSLIKPPDNLYGTHQQRKHKIFPYQTENSPSFHEVFPEIYRRINNNVVVAHNVSTEISCITRAMEINNIKANLNINWQCTYSICNSRLAVAARICNIELIHHNALSDALACGYLYQMHLEGILPVAEIIKANLEEREKKKENNEYPERLSGDILKPDFENVKNKNNPFFMKKVVISGFSSKTKREIADRLKLLGADIDNQVGPNTVYLVAGENLGWRKEGEMKQKIDAGQEAYIISLEELDKMLE